MNGPILYQIVEGPHKESEIPMHPDAWEMDFNTGTPAERVRMILAPWLLDKDRSKILDLVIYYIEEDTPEGTITKLPVTALPLPRAGQYSHGLN